MMMMIMMEIVAVLITKTSEKKQILLILNNPPPLLSGNAQKLIFIWFRYLPLVSKTVSGTVDRSEQQGHIIDTFLP